jgi:iron(III) transport system ATP-binding protein
MTLLNLIGLSKSFGDTQVLKSIDLELKSQELLAVLGASGAGKSTLLRLIAGFERPTSGSMTLNGTEISNSNKVLAPDKRNIGIVPQDAALFPHLSVAQNIGFGLSKWATKEKAARLKHLLELVELTDFADARPESLSGGQAQRVALARALAPRPALVLMDEPFSALDAELRARLRLDIRKILLAEGATAVLVTHDQEEALSLADRVAVLRDGQIGQIGTPTDIYNSPIDIGIATFLGDSVLVEGQVVKGKISTALGLLNPMGKVLDGDKGLTAIRYENFYLLPNPGGEGEVVGQVFFGHDAVLEVKIGDLVIRARSNGPFAPEVGMRVKVWVRGSVNFYAN